MELQESSAKRWRKILYERQGVPDNYVDSSFLTEMKKNLYVRDYKFWRVVVDSGSIYQQLCCCCLFVIVYIYILLGWTSSNNVLLILLVAVSLGYLLLYLLKSPHEKSTCALLIELRTGIIFTALTLALAPLLHTLTATISTDTIYAMTFFLLLANWAFHDYTSSVAIQSSALSVNAGLFASICLASRLPTARDTLVVVMVAIALFALWPRLRQKLKVMSEPWIQLAMTIGLGVATLITLWDVSLVMTVLFICITSGINLACPALLIRMQTLKNNIHGPWDEATIQR